MNRSDLTQLLINSLSLSRAPIGVAFADSLPDGVPSFGGRVPAGCQFWQEAATGVFATSRPDHDSCAIGQYTHNLGFSEASQKDLGDALKVFNDLGYVREQDLPSIPVLSTQPRHVLYGPLDQLPVEPEVVLLFVRADQQLILSEATQQIEGGSAPALGRPACAIVPQAVNTGRAALSLGCCGARAYVDALTPDIALYALPGSKLDAYAERIAALAQANAVLTRFHEIRRRDIAAGGAPSIADSLSALQNA